MEITVLFQQQRGNISKGLASIQENCAKFSQFFALSDSRTPAEFMSHLSLRERQAPEPTAWLPLWGSWHGNALRSHD